MNKYIEIIFFLLLLAFLPASAEILLLNDSNSFATFRDRPAHMPGIIIAFPAPSASSSPQMGRNMQLAHEWSRDENQVFEFGRPVVFVTEGVPKDRLSVARANMARARAFRLDSFK